MKTRNETGCRITRANNGKFGPKICAEVADRVLKYCMKTGQNRTKFVEWCITRTLDDLEREEYLSMSKEDLVDMILGRRITNEVSKIEG